MKLSLTLEVALVNCEFYRGRPMFYGLFLCVYYDVTHGVTRGATRGATELWCNFMGNSWPIFRDHAPRDSRPQILASIIGLKVICVHCISHFNA